MYTDVHSSLSQRGCRGLHTPTDILQWSVCDGGPAWGETLDGLGMMGSTLHTAGCGHSSLLLGAEEAQPVSVTGKSQAYGCCRGSRA